MNVQYWIASTFCILSIFFIIVCDNLRSITFIIHRCAYFNFFFSSSLFIFHRRNHWNLSLNLWAWTAHWRRGRMTSSRAWSRQLPKPPRSRWACIISWPLILFHAKSILYSFPYVLIMIRIWMPLILIVKYVTKIRFQLRIQAIQSAGLADMVEGLASNAKACKDSLNACSESGENTSHFLHFLHFLKVIERKYKKDFLSRFFLLQKSSLSHTRSSNFYSSFFVFFLLFAICRWDWTDPVPCGHQNRGQCRGKVLEA